MEVTIDSCTWKDLLKVLTEVMGREHTVSIKNSILKVKSSNAVSRFKGKDFANGLGMFTMNINLKEALNIHFYANMPVLWCLYCLEGCFEYSDTCGNQYQLKPGQFANCTFAEGGEALLHFPARRIAFNGLWMTPAAYITYKLLGAIPAGIKKLFDNPKSKQTYVHQGQCDIALASCLVQVCNNLNQDWISEIIYEAKALEVLGLQFNYYINK